MPEQVKAKDDHSGDALNMKAFLCLLVGGIAIGTSPILVRYADVTPSSSAFWRVALAIPLLIIWQVYALKSSQKKSAGSTIYGGEFSVRKIVPFIVIGFLFAVDLIFWHWSIQLTSVANATLLANMAVIFTAVGGFFFFGERFSKTFILGLVIALLGAMSLMGHSFEFKPDNLFGDMLGMITAVAYAGYMLASAHARKSFSTVSIVLGTAVFAAIFLLPVALSETGNFIPATLAGWWPLLGLAWISHVVGQSFIVYALAHLPAAFGSVSLLVQPVVAAILAWMLFGEALGLYHFVGATLIIAGILVCRKGVVKN